MVKNTIKLKKYVDIINEYKAGGVITSGMLVAVNSVGAVIAHAVAGGVCSKMFALEDELQGRTIKDNFVSGEPVQCWVTVPGEEVNALLADGEDVAIGEVLVSDGAGKLKVATPNASAVIIEQYPIAIALEAVNMTGSAGVDPSGRIKVRIL